MQETQHTKQTYPYQKDLDQEDGHCIVGCRSQNHSNSDTALTLVSPLIPASEDTMEDNKQNSRSINERK